MKRLDRNNDGRVTKAEAKVDAEVSRRFAELDTDNSGKLDQAEFARFEVDGEVPSSGTKR
jgi:Ca2+-binding EF-hand superfamily protein